MDVHIHIYCMYFTDACSLAHSPPTTAIGPARPRTTPPPLLPPLLPPHAQPHISKAPCIPTGEYNIIQCTIQHPTAYNSTTLCRPCQTT